MYSRIIRIAVAAGALFLLGGCVRKADLTPEPTPEGAIAFDASSRLLKDDAMTKNSQEPITTSSFPNSSTILVYGRRKMENPLLFPGIEVNFGGIAWSYNQPRQWNWDDNAIYDFLAVYQGNYSERDYNKSTPVCADDANPLSVSVEYTYNTATQEQYDLMLAGKRRSYSDPNRTQAVGLQFEHMLSAVKVIIKNGSAENIPTNIYLTGYHFEHMVVSGQAKVSFDNSGDPTFSWSNTNRLSTPIGVVSSINTTLGKNEAYEVNHFHLMIPQLHTGQNGVNYPALVIDYKVGDLNGTSKSARILLKDILKGTESKLTNDHLIQWERGKKYVYTIKLDLDGGVMVTVTTTPWDAEINAETPGLLLPIGY